MIATLVGSSGTLPIDNRPLTSLFINNEGTSVLFDCGEGTQTSIRSLKLKTNTLSAIFFTHRHSDHVLGLPGLLTTMNQQCVDTNTRQCLLIVAPIDAKEILDSLLGAIVVSQLALEFIWLEENEEELQFYGFSVKAILLDHTVPCYGFRYICENKGHLKQDVAEASGLPSHALGAIRNGHFIMSESGKYDKKKLYGDFDTDVFVCYATDTNMCNGLSDLAENADLAVIEGMYPTAAERSNYSNVKHLLFTEAAEIAKDNGVKHLWLTHFSPSIVNPAKVLHDAKKIYGSIKAGYKGLQAEIGVNHEYVEAEESPRNPNMGSRRKFHKQNDSNSSRKPRQFRQ